MIPIKGNGMKANLMAKEFIKAMEMFMKVNLENV